MSGNENNEIERHRYLEILHRFTIDQAPLSSLESICWNIAKTAIAQLGFFDCVVYLLKEDGKSLQQIAAHGPKNPELRNIFNPIEIPVGEGVVGHVAQTGEVQLVSDTRNDPRYIADDDFRLSELAVPIEHDGRTIGVLDSEHPDANFFSEEDIKLFTTIASLASTRIETAIMMDRLEGTVLTLNNAQAKLESQATDLRLARNKAELASEAKSVFLANMSHEIRTPMTTIMGYADLLADGRVEEVQAGRWRKQLVESARHLQELIGNVLDVAAVEAGKVTLQNRAVELVELLESNVELFRPKAELKGLCLTLRSEGKVPSTIETDSVKLKQILTNLISNAIKYTSIGSVSVIICAEQKAKLCELTIKVADTGVGMTNAQSQMAFEPFSRVHDTANMTHIEGTGLGLSLVKSFAELMGGEIEVKSTLGEGSIFTVRLNAAVPSDARWRPIEDGRQPMADPSGVKLSDSDIDLESHRILVCEDSDSIAQIIVMVLEKRGAVVEHASNGLVGLQRCQALKEKGKSFDLIIMDMQMPVMDGYKAASQLKARAINSPILALTAQAIKEDKSKCLAAGCDFYLTKPIDIASFVGQVYEIISEFKKIA